MSLAVAFIIALVTKIGLATFAACFPENTSSTWIFGFWLPIAVMVLYIIFGYVRTLHSSLDERLNYGDSCYYLGFLFTIASIILSLYIIGVTEDEFSAPDLAIRFAAAMVTTLLGMSIRVCLVTFAKKKSDRKPGQPDPIIHGDEPQSGSSQEIYIEANLKNLEKLNKSLVLNIDATEQLRANLVNLGARITSDIEVNSKAFQEFLKEAIDKTNSCLEGTQAAFGKAMNDCTEQTKEKLATLVSESTASTQKFIDDSSKQISKSVEEIDKQSLNSIQRINDAADNIDKLSQSSIQRINDVADKSDALSQSSIQRINDVAEKTVDNVSTAVKNSLESISKQAEATSTKFEKSLDEIIPTKEWQESLKKISQVLNSVIEDFSEKTKLLINTSGNVQQGAQEFADAFSNSAKALNNELEKLISSLEKKSNEMNAEKTDFKKSFQSSMENIEKKLNDISSMSDQLSSQADELKRIAKSNDLDKRGFFSKLFK